MQGLDKIVQERAKGLEAGALQLRIMDCTENGCAGVDAFPAWKVNGVVHYGVMSFDDLAQASGCAKP